MSRGTATLEPYRHFVVARVARVAKVAKVAKVARVVNIVECRRAGSCGA